MIDQELIHNSGFVAEVLLIGFFIAFLLFACCCLYKMFFFIFCSADQTETPVEIELESMS